MSDLDPQEVKALMHNARHEHFEPGRSSLYHANLCELEDEYGMDKVLKAIDINLASGDATNAVYTESIMWMPGMICHSEDLEVEIASRIITRAIRHENPEIRDVAVSCSTSIMGNDAYEYLKEAYDKETIPHLKEFIKVMIDEISLEDIASLAPSPSIKINDGK